MSDRTKLGDRMKEYEQVSRHKLMRRQPVVLRLDGKAFHTFTKGMRRPFDDILSETMESTMKYLCENIQGCVLGYTQSDEITLVLVDYKKRTSDAWFDNNLQKMCSISASMATLAFNSNFRKNVWKEWDNIMIPADEQFFKDMEKKVDKATFDSRAFSLPQNEVVNCLIWRQQDATRNSILSVGQAHFSHREMNGKKTNVVQDMLIVEKGINWNDIETRYKRGSCCIKESYVVNEGTNKEAIRTRWAIDYNIPIFTQDKDYVNKLVYPEIASEG